MISEKGGIFGSFDDLNGGIQSLSQRIRLVIEEQRANQKKLEKPGEIFFLCKYFLCE
jgi:hypothetical protein